MIRRYFSLSAIFCSALLVVTPLAAQMPSAFEDEITVTATGVEETVDEVPVAVTVIDREAIDDAQAEVVADLLRRVPGVILMQSGNQGGVTSLFLRGTESDHTLVMFDGVRLNSPFFGGYDWSQATTAGLERIEVVRGPYSALWGADAVGGVINMVPRRSVPGNHGTLFLEGGEDSWRRYEGNYTYASGGFDLMASGVRREGEDELPNSDFEVTDLLIDVGWSWGKGSRIAVLVQDLETDTGIPFNGATLTPLRRNTAEQKLLAVPIRWRLSDKWSLEMTASSVDRELGFSDPDDPFGFTASTTQADTVSARLASHHTVGQHTFSWGGEWREDEVDDASSYGVNLVGDSTDMLSAFVQNVWRFSDRFRLVVGARWDESDDWGSEVSPRLNLGWRFSKAVELRVGYGEAFRQPSVGELFYPFSGNPNLEAETSRTAEIGLAIRKPGSRIRWEINLFDTDLDNMIQYDFATFMSQNVAEASITGVELSHRASFYGDFNTNLSVTWLDTEDTGGLPLLRRPEWSASYTLSGIMWDNVRGDLTVLWMDDRTDVDPVTFERATADSFFTVNFSLAWKMQGASELTFRVLNATDEDYEAVLGYPAPGRRLIGGIRFSL